MGFSFLTRDGTCTPCIARGSLHSWTARELPHNLECLIIDAY